MKVKGLVAICIAAALSLYGCSTILDTHPNDVGPSGPGPIPGLPVGDSIIAGGNVLFNGGNIQLMSGSQSQTAVALITGGKPHETTEYTIKFSGVKLTTSQQPVLAIDALDIEGHIACGLEIAGGEFRLVSEAGVQEIGAYTGAADEHRVIMRLAVPQALCFVNIVQVPQGTDGPLTQPVIDANGGFIDDHFGDLDRIRVEWEQPSGGATSYFLGPMIISKRD